MLGRVNRLRILFLKVGVNAHRASLSDLPEHGDDRSEGESQNRVEDLTAPFLAGHLVKDSPRHADRAETEKKNRHQLQSLADDVREISRIAGKNRTLRENGLAQK